MLWAVEEWEDAAGWHGECSASGQKEAYIREYTENRKSKDNRKIEVSFGERYSGTREDKLETSNDK